MEKHTDLKELLLVFLKVYFDRCVNDNEDEEIVLNEFIANNSLELDQEQQLDIPDIVVSEPNCLLCQDRGTDFPEPGMKATICKCQRES